MPDIEIHSKWLYVMVLLAMGFTVVAALGPGLWTVSVSAGFTHDSWQYLFFNKICHQDPLRSFQIGGVQMAACARCLGIYTSFLLGWILLPILALFGVNREIWKRIFLTAAILLNLIDIAGNFFGVWTNTLNSRFLLGAVFGLAVTVFLANEFFKKINKAEVHHGI